jgi:hypothetical protein
MVCGMIDKNSAYAEKLVCSVEHVSLAKKYDFNLRRFKIMGPEKFI